jgi:hypothetical protein
MDDLNNNYIMGENHDKYEYDGENEEDGGCGGGGGDGGCGGDEGDGGCGGDGGDGGCGGDSGSGGDGGSGESNSLLTKSINNNGILNELFIKQLKNITSNKKLSYCDIQRISKFLKASIFGNTCSLWTGYITNDKNINKGVYINFYYNKKKIALHRLLYANYVGEISDKEYIKYNCVNKGKCCNIHHMSKFTYKKNDNITYKTKKDGVQQIDTNLTLEL